MDIFGSLFSRPTPVDPVAEARRKQEEAFSRPRFIGLDLGRDDMSCKTAVRINPDGTQEVLSIHLFKKTIDL